MSLAATRSSWSRSAHAGFVRLLLEAKAEPNAATTNSGATPLHLAAASGNPAIVADLVEWGALVDARESAWGQTALTFAAANNRVRNRRLLGSTLPCAAWLLRLVRVSHALCQREARQPIGSRRIFVHCLAESQISAGTSITTITV